MKKNNIISATITVLLAISMFSGCSSGGTEELVPANASKNENVASSDNSGKTKIVFLRGGTEPERKEYWNKTIKAFEEQNPDIEVEYQEAPYGNDFETKLNTGFASGTAPDVINFTMASMGTRIPLGQYAPLDEFMPNWSTKDDYLESVLDLGSRNGKIYGIGIYTDPRIMLWNKELFKSAGLDPEKPPANWQELKEYHEKLTVKDENGTVKQAGFAIPLTGSGLQHIFSVFIEQNGVKNLVNEDDNTILLNDPKSIEAAQFLLDLVEIGTIPWDCTAIDQDPFLSGQSAITITTVSNYKSLMESDMKDKIGIAKPMTQQKEATFCGVHFMFMSGDTKNKEASWKFIEFVTNEENTWQRYLDLGFTPLRNSLKEKYISEDPEARTALYYSIDAGSGSPKVPYANSVYNITNEAMEKILYKVATAKEALDEAAVKLQKEIDNQ